MDATAILIHGFNVWDGGRATVGKLRPWFANRGVPYLMVNYGWVGLLGTRLKNRSVAKVVAKSVVCTVQAGRQAIIVGHSNGCAIAHLAGQILDRDFPNISCRQVVYINPALDADIQPPASFRSLQVWHSPGDVPVKLAEKLLMKSKARPWGDMGAVGYTGTDLRVVNINKQGEGFLVRSEAHSDVFDPERVAYFGPVLTDHALSTLTS